MSDQTMDEDVELEAAPRKGGLSGKKLTLFIVLPLLLIGGVIAGLVLTGTAEKLLGGDDQQTAEAAQPKQTVFYDMPTLLVNLNSEGGRSSFLKLSVSLELESKADRAHLEKMMPRVVDNFQVYLRELRVEDLQGSAGLQRLREELLMRVDTAVKKASVKDVLFKEMLVQ